MPPPSPTNTTELLIRVCDAMLFVVVAARSVKGNVFMENLIRRKKEKEETDGSILPSGFAGGFFHVSVGFSS